MALFAIGDLHLSLSVEKPMDIFSGWHGYTERLCESWRSRITPEDTVVLAGDTSWGMTLDEALADLRLIDSLPGRQKLLLKGNHDYWWNSAGKMQNFFEANGLSTLKILHNNAYASDGFIICGSRGWIFENGQQHDDKIINREAGRIEASIKAGEKLTENESGCEKLLFLHYPPVFGAQELGVYLDIMRKYGISRCFYGHIHGAGHKIAMKGPYKGIDFTLISADFLKFSPVRIEHRENSMEI